LANSHSDLTFFGCSVAGFFSQEKVLGALMMETGFGSPEAVWHFGAVPISIMTRSAAMVIFVGH